MNPELSRRASLLMHTHVMYDLGFSEQEKFVAAVEQATSFATLDSRWQTLIVSAEQELRQKQPRQQTDDGSLQALA